MTNTLDGYGAHWVTRAYLSFYLLEAQRRSLVVTRGKITTKATGGNDRGRGCDVLSKLYKPTEKYGIVDM